MSSGASTQHYAAHVAAQARPDVIIEAVGHQVTTLQDAVSSVADGGRIFYFGVPDDEIYPINMQRLLRGNLTLMSGTTLERQRVLAEAEQYLGKFPELVGVLIHPPVQPRRRPACLRGGGNGVLLPG